MKLFSSMTAISYFDGIKNDMLNEIANIKDEEIIQMDIEEWSQYYSEKYKVDLLELYVDELSISMGETKLKKHNSWYSAELRDIEPEFFMVDAYDFFFSIPFDGDARLLELEPRTRILSSFESEKVVKPTDEACGSIVIKMSYAVQDLKKHDDINVYVKTLFERVYSGYASMVSYVNSDGNSFNIGLQKNAYDALIKRKERTNNLISISKAMNISISLSSNAPNVKPILLKRKETRKPNKPGLNPINKKPAISESDYTNIINIIHSQCTTMEDTARSFNPLQEEAIRDIILSNLNTHYNNMATGETFRKNGKTDIRILFEGDSAFVGECKIWHGYKKFCEAIAQLCSYATWRDVKLALIVFNKDNKDFESILTKIDLWTKEETVSVIRKLPNQWECRCLRKDTEMEVVLTICVYDLSL